MKPSVIIKGLSISPCVYLIIGFAWAFERVSCCIIVGLVIAQNDSKPKVVDGDNIAQKKMFKVVFYKLKIVEQLF